MFDHVKFGVSDFQRSKAFYLQVLAPIGVQLLGEGEPSYGVELGQPNGASSLCLFQTAEKPAHLHLAFIAESRAQVDEFYRLALALSAADNGAPGLRSQYNANYYAAFVIDPDGHNIEMVCQKPQ